MPEPCLIFKGPVEVFYFYSYKFVDKRNRLIPLNALQKIVRKGKSKFDPSSILHIEHMDFDIKCSDLTFSDAFNSDESRPLAITISPKKVKIPSQVDDSPANGISPRHIQVRLSQYGIMTIRLHFVLGSEYPKKFGKEFLNYIKHLNDTASRYAAVVVRRTIEVWNSCHKYRIFRRKLSLDYAVMDWYKVIFLRDVELQKGRKLSLLKREGIKGNREISKMVAGLAVLSSIWEDYTDGFVDEFIDSDLSTTNNEFQFVLWRNSLIYYERANEGVEVFEDSDYGKYLYDMILGLELFFIIRSSLQLLEDIIHDEVKKRIVLSSGILKKVRFLKYFRLIVDFDKWLMLITEWKTYQRFAYLTHFHNFLEHSLKTMRIEGWLNTISDKIAIIREDIKVQTDLTLSFGLVFLTLFIFVFTVLGIIFGLKAEISRMLSSLGF